MNEPTNSLLDSGLKALIDECARGVKDTQEQIEHMIAPENINGLDITHLLRAAERLGNFKGQRSVLKIIKPIPGSHFTLPKIVTAFDDE